MNAAALGLKLFLDEGVPESVALTFEERGYKVIRFKEGAIPGSPDPIVATISTENSAVLVAFDGDMRKLAQQRGVGQSRYRSLSLIKLSCGEEEAPSRLQASMSLIEHEWARNTDVSTRRIFIEIGKSFIRTHR